MRKLTIIWDFDGTILPSTPFDSEQSLLLYRMNQRDKPFGWLKKGYAKVMEREHTLILGWNERVLEILRELILANESESDAIVVILSEMDKEEMDDYLAAMQNKVLDAG